MKYVIIVSILLTGCYSKRIDVLEKNQVEIVKAINCTIDEACLTKIRSKNVQDSNRSTNNK